MIARKTLIVGFGNVLLGDDDFGVEVVRRLAAIDLPADVHRLDVGIGGIHCVLQLMEGLDADRKLLSPDREKSIHQEEACVAAKQDIDDAPRRRGFQMEQG